ncbi:MAG: hypothetical protein M0T73_02135 [Deltaproteobacteria bacterium]|nr:hypothetical protein [Deltaproteobacteria bacterium]
MKLSENIFTPREKPRISLFLLVALIVTLFTLTFGGVYSDAWITEHGAGRGGYVLPPNLIKDGISFAGSRVPVERPGVHERIVEQLNYLLMDRRASVTEWFNRFVAYGPILTGSLKKNDVPVDLVYLSILLSELDPNHKTRSGGIGWWALGPSRDGSTKNIVPWVSTSEWDDRRDPEISTYIAAQFFQTLRKREPKYDWLLIISTFLDGSDKINPILTKSPGFSYWDIITPPTSDLLIPRLIALKILLQNRNFYCVNITQDKPLAFDNLGRIRLSKDLPLSMVAKWTGTISRNIWKLNTGVDIMSAVLPKTDKRSPNGYLLRTPQGTGAKVKKLLENEGYMVK